MLLVEDRTNESYSSSVLENETDLRRALLAPSVAPLVRVPSWSNWGGMDASASMPPEKGIMGAVPLCEKSLVSYRAWERKNKDGNSTRTSGLKFPK